MFRRVTQKKKNIAPYCVIWPPPDTGDNMHRRNAPLECTEIQPPRIWVFEGHRRDSLRRGTEYLWSVDGLRSER